MTVRLLVITGTTCSGKSHVEGIISNKLGVKHVKTSTTRKPRKGDTFDYYSHLSVSSFLEGLSANKYVEHSSYAQHLYGISKDALNDVILSGHNRWSVVLDEAGAHSIGNYCLMNDIPIRLGCIVLSVPKQILHRRLFCRVLKEHKYGQMLEEEAVDTLIMRQSEINTFDHFKVYSDLSTKKEHSIITYDFIHLLDNSFPDSIGNILLNASKFFED